MKLTEEQRNKIGKTEMVPCSLLIFNPDIYPRCEHGSAGVHGMAVSDYAKAMKAGDKFPPIVVDVATTWIVDGVTRWCANKQNDGEEAKVLVTWGSWDTEGQMLLEAYRLNVAHGQRLTKYDIKRCRLLARKFGVSDDKVNEVLGTRGVPLIRIGKKHSPTKKEPWHDIEVETPEGKTVIQRVPSKRATDHLREEKLSPRESKAYLVQDATPPKAKIWMVIHLLRSERLVDLSDEGMLPLLRELYTTLREFLAKVRSEENAA